MSSLYGILSTAVGSLSATQGALNATTDNITNVNTPGFTRRRAILSEQRPDVEAGITYGRGVQLDGIESVRDQMLELRIDAEAQQHGAAQAKVDSLQQLDSMLSDLDNGLPVKLDAFFNSLNALSAQPADTSLRQAVLTTASNLVSGFNRTSRSLSDMARGLDYQVSQSVADLNQTLSDIARLDAQVSQITGLGGDASVYEDQRALALRKLSELADVAVVQSDNGLMITTARGTALVVGNKAYRVTAEVDSSGHQILTSEGRDVTAEFTGGRLGAILSVRDEQIPAALRDLDNVAYALGTAMNQANAAGFDLNGAAGGDLFGLPSSASGSATALSLAISDGNKIAASSNGDAGSNGNLSGMIAIRTAALVNGQSLSDVLANLSSRVGDAASDAQTQLEASESILNQLQDRRASISGVSIDEEAANLIRYQRAYEAAARVIDAANQMLEIACNLGRV
jgi:flagellar hook-associated protein 1